MSNGISQQPFQLVAGHPALDFINTLDWRFREQGTEELLNSYDDLLRFTEQSDLLSAPQAKQLQQTVKKAAASRVLHDCIELREALAPVLYTALDGHAPSAAQLRLLEKHLKPVLLHQRLSWQNAQLEWTFPEATNEAELPLWQLALSSSELMASERWTRMRVCDNLECRWLFLDTSKNHTRRWCDMKICGNRMKARRFKAQHKA